MAPKPYTAYEEREALLIREMIKFLLSLGDTPDDVLAAIITADDPVGPVSHTTTINDVVQNLIIRFPCKNCSHQKREHVHGGNGMEAFCAPYLIDPHEECPCLGYEANMDALVVAIIAKLSSIAGKLL